MDTEPNQAIGVTSSPNTTQTIKLQILAKARSSALEGNLVTCTLKAPDGDVLILAQMTELITSNKWFEKDEFATVITAKGTLPFLTEPADITTGIAAVIGAYKKLATGWIQVPLAIPVGSGISVTVAQDAQLREIVKHTSLGNTFYVGRTYGSDTVYAPLDLRHDGTGPGGHGEAYMGGIFGPSGSGKSVMTATILGGFARNPTMGMLLIDPQGEFKGDRMKKPTFDFSFLDILEKSSGGRFNRASHALSVKDLLIRDVSLFVEILKHMSFLQPILKSSNKTPQAYENLEEYLTDELKLASGVGALRWEEIQVARPAFLDELATVCAKTYTKEDERQDDLTRKVKTNKAILGQRWNEAIKMFEDDGSKRHVSDIIKSVLTGGKIFILDISPETGEVDDSYKRIVLLYIVKQLRQTATIMFKSHVVAATNALLILDEAHLFAGDGHEDGSVSKELSMELTKAIAMMRKLNCGILLSTQFITQIRKDIFRQLHYRIYATGLIGTDKDWMEEREGKESVELYEKLPQPQKSRKYCYMVGGNIGCLGSTGRPLIIEGFKEGAPGIYRENGITHGSLTGMLDVFKTS